MKTERQFVLCILLLALQQGSLHAQAWDISGNGGINNNNFLGTTNNNSLIIKTNNAERIRIKSGGNVGIGTTNPNALLHVKGVADSVIASFDGGTRTYAGFYENDLYRGYIGSFAGNAEDVDFGTGIGNSKGKVHLTLQAVPKLTVSSSGVGIGTTSPAVPLQIEGGGGAALSGGGYVQIGTSGVTNLGLDNDEILARNNGAASTLQLNKSGGDINVGSGGLYYKGDTKRVGIGTSAPIVPLQVIGGSALSLSGGGTIVTGATNSFNLGISTGSIQARNNAAGSLLNLNADGGDVNISRGALFVEAATNNVGIGATPSAKFHVVVGSEATLTGGGYIVAGPTTFNNIVIDADEIQARNNNASASLHLNPDGGSTIVGNALVVDGDEILFGVGGGKLKDGGNFNIRSGADFLPDFDDFYQLGSSPLRWKEVWSADGSINTSDIRDKKNIRELDHGLKEIMQLRPVKFNWKNEDNPEDKLGLIAQDLQKVLPEVVKSYENRTNEKTGKKEKVPVERLGVMYADIIPVLIKGMQEQEEKINSQDKKIEALTRLVQQLTPNHTVTGNAVSLNIDAANGASLKQNAPNPFNQRTVINYYLPQNTGSAIINITDMNGRIIKTFASIAKGSGQLIIEAGQLTPGTYQYALIVNGKLIDTKKMVLMK